MLATRYILFTALEGVLVDSASRPGAAAAEAFEELARRNVPLVLSSEGTRAQLEALRRKLEHTGPFATENGGGLFLPDGYFAMHVEGGERRGRYFCLPFARDYAETCAALEEIAEEAGAEVQGYSQMSSREIADNTGLAPKEAELAAQREFSERFFFAGDTDGGPRRFGEAARGRGWQASPPPERAAGRDDAFWTLSRGNDAGKAVKSLMEFYRKSLRTRLGSIGIGNSAEHLPLLRAVDHAILLPRRGKELDETAQARLPRAKLGENGGAAGWNRAVLEFLERAYETKGRGEREPV